MSIPSPLSFQVSRQLWRASLALLAVASLFASNYARATQVSEEAVPYPATPAGERLESLLRCVNQKDAASRLEFLKSGFTDPDELEQREGVAAQLHENFAPLRLVKVVDSSQDRIVAHCGTSQEVVLLVELNVTSDAEQRISEIGMEPVETDEAVALPAGMAALFDAEGKSLPEYRGIWEAKGYGYIFEVKEDSSAVYNVTTHFGWAQEFEERLFVHLPETPSTKLNEATFTFHPLEPGYRMTRLNELPARCQTSRDWTPPELLELFVEIFREHYPFFERRDFDFEKRVATAKSKIEDSSSELELFEALSGLIDDLDDGHVSLSATIDGESQLARTGGEDTLSRLRDSFEPTEETKTYGKYFRAWRDQLRDGIRNEILKGSIHVEANDKIIWGRADDNIGYLSISGMGGYTYGAIDSQVEELHVVLNSVLTSLQDTDALILDISFNGGGSDLFSLEIASHFTNQQRLAFSKWPRDHEQYRLNRYVQPIRDRDAQGIVYLKPLYLVTSDITASAAEIFTMSLRAMPQVTTVGMPTEGALSDILFKSLPNGWELGLSNEIYVDHQDICHEGPGIPPMIPLDVFDAERVQDVGHAAAIEKLLGIIRKEVK